MPDNGIGRDFLFGELKNEDEEIMAKVLFLVESQNPDGSWCDDFQTFYTSLSVYSLMGSDRFKRNDDVRKSVSKGVSYLVKKDNVEDDMSLYLKAIALLSYYDIVEQKSLIPKIDSCLESLKKPDTLNCKYLLLLLSVCERDDDLTFASSILKSEDAVKLFLNVKPNKGNFFYMNLFYIIKRAYLDTEDKFRRVSYAREIAKYNEFQDSIRATNKREKVYLYSCYLMVNNNISIRSRGANAGFYRNLSDHFPELTEREKEMINENLNTEELKVDKVWEELEP